jgi:hypothetical protein
MFCLVIRSCCYLIYCTTAMGRLATVLKLIVDVFDKHQLTTLLALRGWGYQQSGSLLGLSAYQSVTKIISSIIAIAVTLFGLNHLACEHNKV